MIKKFCNILVLILCVLLGGCTNSKLTNVETSFDPSKISDRKITYNVYHSRTQDDTWGKIASLSCEALDNHFCEIRIAGEDNAIKIIVEEHYEKENDDGALLIFTNEVDSFKFAIDGFNGLQNNIQSGTFKTQDIEDEQLYKIYPISNENGAFLQNVSLDNTYDLYHENIDNILISIEINRY